MVDGEPRDIGGAAAGAPDGEGEAEAHAGDPERGGDEAGAGDDLALGVAPGVGHDAAEQSEGDAGGGEHNDEQDIVAPRREWLEVVEAGDADEDDGQEDRARGQLAGPHLSEHDGDEQDVDDVVGGGHFWFPPEPDCAWSMRARALSHQAMDMATKSRPKEWTRPGPIRPVSVSGPPRSAPGTSACSVC